MMCKSGLTHVITMDLHQKEIQGFFDCPVDNLRASPFLLQYIQESVSTYREISSILFQSETKIGLHSLERDEEIDFAFVQLDPRLSKFRDCG